jgi:hypothetical protein
MRKDSYLVLAGEIYLREISRTIGYDASSRHKIWVSSAHSMEIMK